MLWENRDIQDPLRCYTNIGIPYLVEQSEDHTLQRKMLLLFVEATKLSSLEGTRGTLFDVGV